MGIGNWPTLVEAEVFHVSQYECRNTGGMGHADMGKVGANDVLEQNCRSQVFLFVVHLHIAKRNSPCVSNEEAVNRHGTKAVWIRIVSFNLWRLNIGIFLRPAALMQNGNIAQTQVLNEVIRDSRDDRCLPRRGSRNHHVTDLHAPQLTDRNVRRSAHPAAEPYEEWYVHRFAHSNVANGNIFEQPTVYRLQCNSAAKLDDTIRNCDVAKPSIRFRPKLDSSIARSLSGGDTLEGRIQQRTLLIAAGDIAVRDGHVVGGARKAEPERAFETNPIVPGRVHAAIRDVHIATTVDVVTVSVCIDFQIVN